MSTENSEEELSLKMTAGKPVVLLPGPGMARYLPCALQRHPVSARSRMHALILSDMHGKVHCALPRSPAPPSSAQYTTPDLERVGCDLRYSELCHAHEDRHMRLASCPMPSAIQHLL